MAGGWRTLRSEARQGLFSDVVVHPPRHVRALRQNAERDVALVEQALSPLLRRTDASSRGRAGELAPELAKRLDEVRAIFVRGAIERVLS